MSNIPQFTVPLCTLLLTTFACDPEDLQVETRDGAVDASVMLAALDEDADEDSALVDTVVLADDVKVSFFALPGGAMGVLLEGPATATLTDELKAVKFVVDTAHDADEAVALMLDAGEALAAGHDLPYSESLRGAVKPAPSVGGSSLDHLQAPPRTTQVACDGVDAGAAPGHNTAANQGDCTTFTRTFGNDQSFEGDDLIAYAGHVVAVTGSVFWDIRLQNWGVSGWFWGLQSLPIAQGKQAYWYLARIDNDFNLTTRVEATSSTSSFHHDFARCHDWYPRVNYLTSTLIGGCGIDVNGASWYWHDGNYVGADPSNIPTGIQWN